MLFFTTKPFFLIFFFGFVLSGCGFHLQNKTEIPKQFETLVFTSTDPYSFLSREIKNVLTANHIKVVGSNEQHGIPELRLVGYGVTKDTVSVYQDGKAAEYQLILTVNAAVLIAKQDLYPINVRIFRSFFDNPSAALAKNTEQTLIIQEMYSRAAERVVHKLNKIGLVRSIQHDKN